MLKCEACHRSVGHTTSRSFIVCSMDLCNDCEARASTLVIKLAGIATDHNRILTGRIRDWLRECRALYELKPTKEE